VSVSTGLRPCLGGRKNCPRMKPRINEWTKLRGSSIREIFVDGFVVESRFGVGEGVREAGCGFRRVCPWGKAVYE